MLNKIKLFFSFFTDDYLSHQIRSKISFYINYWKIKFISIFRSRIVAISLIEHIGDIIANEPVSREVRKKYPEAVIIWFVRNPYKDLIRFNPNIDKVLTVYCLTSWILINKKIKFEAVYDLHFNGRTCNKCHVPLAKKNSNDLINGTNYFNYGGLLKAVCLHNRLELEETTPLLYIPSSFYSKIQRNLPAGKFIVVHCASNEAIKDWDNKKWDYLIYKIINEFRYIIVEIGSKSKISIKSDYYNNLCGKLSILESAALIRKAELFIGIDSGPAHISNAIGTPGVILLGEYYYGMKNYNPYSGNYGALKHCRLVQSDSLVKNISTESVLENFHSLRAEINKAYDN